MRFLIRLISLCIGALLLATPAAFACGELVAMTSQCPMAETAETAGSMGNSPCHNSGQMLKSCCDVRSDSNPTLALLFGSTKLLSALEATDLELITPLTALPAHTTPADAFLLHDLGRYTLFSSFLL